MVVHQIDLAIRLGFRLILHEIKKQNVEKDDKRKSSKIRLISYVNCLTYSLVTIYLHHLTLWVYMLYIVGLKLDDLPSIIKKTTVNTIVKNLLTFARNTW